jgi:predicted metal-dependent phosphoesterase TrpH
MIDLHAHSTFSDGSLTPEELAALAAQEGLSAVALTDHDCTDGVPRFLAACEAAGIEGVAGVEISADCSKGTMHVLGYLLDCASPRLQDVLVRIRNGREIRNRRILEKLNALGLAMDWDEVAGHAGEDVVGRPHFAKVMLARGYVKDKDEAFDKFLGKGKPAYVDRFRLTARDSIDVLHDAGGLAVLGHPFTLDLGKPALRECVRELAGFGLDGIETYYSEHSPEQVRQYEELAADFGLIRTGGSDFHGEVNPDVRLGRGFGQLRVEEAILAAMKQRAASAAQRAAAT